MGTPSTITSRNIARVRKSAGFVLTPISALNEINKCQVCFTFEVTPIDAGFVLTLWEKMRFENNDHPGEITRNNGSLIHTS